MRNRPVAKMFAVGRCSQKPGLLARSQTAVHDEVRDADRPINFTRS